MELLFAIAPVLIAGVVGYLIFLILEWIADRRKMKKKLDRIKRSLGKARCAKLTLSIGEEQTLGPGEDKQKVGTVSNEEVEEMNEAERLIKEANNRTIN